MNNIIHIETRWYNPMKPKCRNCIYWDGPRDNLYNICINKDFKGREKYKKHNALTCTLFKLEKRKEIGE